MLHGRTEKHHLIEHRISRMRQHPPTTMFIVLIALVPAQSRLDRSMNDGMVVGEQLHDDCHVFPKKPSGCDGVGKVGEENRRACAP